MTVGEGLTNEIGGDMATNASPDYATLFFQHFAILRAYAERVFLDGGELDDHECEDLRSRMKEFFHVGACCDFTEQQLVSLMFAELFDDE